MDLTKLRQPLGEPVIEDENCLLFQADCVEAMRKLAQTAPRTIDLTVTSPPYNIGKEYENARPAGEYLDWSEEWIKAVYDLIRNDGTFWLNLGYISVHKKGKAVPIPYLLWDRVPFFLIQEVVWNYGAGVAARKMFSPRNEKFLWYVKDPDRYTFNLDDVRYKNVKYPNQKKNGKLKCNKLGKNPTDVWQFPKVTSGRQRSSKE